MLPFLQRGIRQSVIVLCAWQARPRRHREGARAGGCAYRCRSRTKSCSPAAAPRRATSRSAAVQPRCRDAKPSSPPPSSIPRPTPAARCCRRTATTSAASDRARMPSSIPKAFEPLIDGNTSLVTVIHAQNEIGTLQPVAEIARLAKASGALMHADAAQSVGKIPVDVNAMGVDLLVDRRPQALRAERHRHSVCAARLESSLGSGRRRTGAWQAARHRKCRVHRGARRSLPAGIRAARYDHETDKGGGGPAVAASAGRCAGHRSGRRSRAPACRIH